MTNPDRTHYTLTLSAAQMQVLSRAERRAKEALL